MSRTFDQLLELVDEIEKFPLGDCGPSDDPDKQTSFLYAFRDIAKRFVSTANRAGIPGLSELTVNLDTSPEHITDAYDLRVNIFCAIDYLRDTTNNFEIEKVPSIKKIERYDLISQIAVDLQSRMNTTGINVFLGGFGVEHEMVSIVPSKRVYVENLLAKSGDTVVLKIAQELDIPVPNATAATAGNLERYLKSDGYKAALHDFNRALSYLEADSEQALGSASSTLESICKSILDQFTEPHPKDESLQPLVKAVFEKMELSPDGHADGDIKRVLGGLLNAAIGVGVLRTKYSGFHGKSGEQKRKRLTARHARLAVNSCTTVGLFLIETYIERFKKEYHPDY